VPVARLAIKDFDIADRTGLIGHSHRAFSGKIRSRGSPCCMTVSILNRATILLWLRDQA
jgi:hypothetical protein